ncbi:DJ-1/PfpI family protein [Evansella sp. AB-P1]|uniref:DJ-1/PfpI family protein n=1 Tax=Evansella sp. AB-P1 TaxID=3037653 RepID=UPI00241EEA35|nr:DJ-1/PfpI family protein [Evansella sp. AB-P1]MDG5788496.1 DJ-1/PfpI family protein [Evansella sp. AB-P1]
MTKRILILTGDAAETLEVIYPLYRCIEEGFETTVAVPNKEEVQTVVHDRQPGIMEVSTERLAYRVPAQKKFSEVNPEDYDALIIPGGRAPEHIRTKPEAVHIVGHFLRENKVTGVICHGAIVFLIPELKELVLNKKITAVPTCRFEVEESGAQFSEELVFTDGNIVSAQTWRDLPGFMKQFLEAIGK